MRLRMQALAWPLALPTLILLSFTALTAHAAEPGQTDIKVVRNGVPHRPLFDVEIRADGHGLAVGDRGTALVTADSGGSWTEQQLDTELALLGVAQYGERRIVVGQMGLIRYSDDGEIWHEAESDTTERLLRVDMNGSGLAVAVGSFGTILVSSDGGENWRRPDFDVSQVVEHAYQAHLNDVHVAEDGTVMIAGEFSLILRSPDGGGSWEVAHSGDVSLFGLHVRPDGVGYAVGQEGTVLRTDDRGETWTVRATSLEANLLDVWSGADGTVVVPGMRHMIVSGDDGETWSQVHAGDVDRNWYVEVAATEQGVLAVGHAGRVLLVEKRTGG